MSTPGAGVDPKKVVRVGKRIRNQHRKANSGLSMRQFADIYDPERSPLAVAWFDNKARSK